MVNRVRSSLCALSFVLVCIKVPNAISYRWCRARAHACVYQGRRYLPLADVAAPLILYYVYTYVFDVMSIFFIFHVKIFIPDSASRTVRRKMRLSTTWTRIRLPVTWRYYYTTVFECAFPAIYTHIENNIRSIFFSQ